MLHLFNQGDLVIAKRLVVAASLALLAGCSSDKTTGTGQLSGTLSFTYSGATSGTFNASGAFNPGTFETVQWAAGSRDDANDFMYVGAAVPRTSTSHDFFAVEIEGDAVGSYSAATNCSTNCAFVDIAFGANNSGSGLPLFLCFLEAGTVTITEITATRVRGTFSGTGSCLPPMGSAVAFTVTGGTFDVALIADPGL